MRKPSHLFVSFKTARAIPCNPPLRRDFLLQNTLDVRVRRIEYHPTVVLDDRVVRIDAVVVDRDDGRYAVDFVDSRPNGDPLGAGLLQLAIDRVCSGILAVSAADVRREPRLSSARQVWDHARMNVNWADRDAIVETLEAEGPVPLRAIDGLVSTSRDSIAVVYALACEGTIAIDLSDGIDGRTIVRPGLPSAVSTRLRFGT